MFKQSVVCFIHMWSSSCYACTNQVNMFDVMMCSCTVCVCVCVLHAVNCEGFMFYDVHVFFGHHRLQQFLPHSWLLFSNHSSCVITHLVWVLLYEI